MADVNDIANRIWDNYLNSLTDIAYGASRALNGLSFGGLDYLGDKFGIDTRMRGYLNTLSPEEQLLREIPGNFNEYAGAGLGLGKVLKGVGLANTRLQRWNGKRELIKQLERGRDFKDIKFGKIDEDKYNRLNQIRGDVDSELVKSRQVSVPADRVGHIHERRVINNGYTPKETANSIYDALFNKKSKIYPTRYDTLQEFVNEEVKPKNSVLVGKIRDGDGIFVKTGYMKKR